MLTMFKVINQVVDLTFYYRMNDAMKPRVILIFTHNFIRVYCSSIEY